MDKWYEVKQKYCDRCIHRNKCYKPCPLVLSAIWNLPCEQYLYERSLYQKHLTDALQKRVTESDSKS